MRPGRPKSDASKPARRLARNNDTATAGAEAKAKAKDKPERAPNKRGLLRALMANPLLTAGDKAAITQAHADGFTPADLSAMTTYELRLAQRLFEADKIDAKALLIAINKATSHVAAAVQLADPNGGGGGAHITVTYEGAGKSSTRPEIADRAAPHPVVGDIIETE